MEHCFRRVRDQHPLIHNITNYVTVNDCANILLAAGASPIMADDPGEVEEITGLCAGLNINIGTLNSRTIPSMFLAGKTACRLGKPVILDPVGAGASTLRTRTALDLVEQIPFTVIRGNISEIKALAQGTGGTKGVDADVADRITAENLPQVVDFARAYAQKTGAVLAITGATDLVTDGDRAFVITNGHRMMASVTGTGCQLSALIAAFVAANRDKALEATVAALCTMGLAGEIAYDRLSPQDGNATYRNCIIDAIYRMTPERLAQGARWQLLP